MRRDANEAVGRRGRRKVDVRGAMKWFVFSVVCVMVAGFANTASAQDVAKVEVSGGWNYMAVKSNADEDWTHFSKGWYGDVAVNLSGMWAVVGQVSGGYKTLPDVGGPIDVRVHPYVFGIRASARRNPKVSPFAQFLAGATSIKATQGSDEISDTFPTLQMGGGANIKVSENLGARVSADYFRILDRNDSELTGGEPLQGMRLAAGIVVGF